VLTTRRSTTLPPAAYPKRFTGQALRRSFLCGFDHVAGKDYEHRRLFIEQRIHLLSSIFAIDIAAYAVMSNHTHLVVKLTPELIEHWSDDEVLQRWTSLFKGPLLVQKKATRPIA
jgi:hypothetical protein